MNEKGCRHKLEPFQNKQTLKGNMTRDQFVFVLFPVLRAVPLIYLNRPNPEKYFVGIAFDS